jgi:hypothetical protein
MRSVLEFLGETYVPTCVEPLNRCINSSFADETTRHDCPAATSASIDLARRFNVELHDGDPPAVPRAQFDAAFETNVRFARNLDGEYAAAQSMVASLQSERLAERVLTDTQIARQRKMLDACGVLLGVQLAAAIAAVIGGAERMPRDASAVWLTLAMIGVVVYAWLRRAGLCALSKHILGARKSARILDISFPERIDENTLVRPGKMQHMSKGAEVAGSAQDRA